MSSPEEYRYQHISSTIKPEAKYSKFSDGIRQITPGPLQCSMFCGGQKCKYCNPMSHDGWDEDQKVIKGLYSQWVGEKILAMSRPSKHAIKKYDIVDQFKKAGITSVINLQRPGEHISCGFGLQEGGFSYVPQDFMDNDIFFYNFGWDDYGVRSLPSILDMVKVFDFAVQEGKAAVHCHAGLGRTGVLIACYLMYSKRMDADHAVTFVRQQRPGAIQTKGQITCCQQFSQYLLPFRVVFASVDDCAYPFTLSQYIERQKHMLHGYEARDLKNIPKIIYVIAKRLIELANHETSSFEQQLSKMKILSLMEQAAPGAFASIRESPEMGRKKVEELRVRDDSEVASGGGGGNGFLTVQENPRARRSRSANLDSREGDSPNAQPLQPKRGGSRSPQPRRSREPSYQRRCSDSSEEEEDSEGDLVARSDNFISYQLERERASRRQRSRSSVALSVDTALGSVTSPQRRRINLPRRGSILSDITDNEVGSSQQEAFMVAAALAFDASLQPVDDESDDKTDAHEAVNMRVDSFKHQLNTSEPAWKILKTEEDPYVLVAIMYAWLEELKDPVLCKENIEDFVQNCDEPKMGTKRLDKKCKHTIDCILTSIAKINPLNPDQEVKICQRLIKVFTHKNYDEVNKSKQLVEFFRNYLNSSREELLEHSTREELDSDSLNSSASSSSLACDSSGQKSPRVQKSKERKARSQKKSPSENIEKNSQEGSQRIEIKCNGREISNSKSHLPQIF